MYQPPSLDRDLLFELFRFNASLGLYRFFKGIDYTRTVEFPVIAAEVLRRRSEPLMYLDVGSGNSILPIFIVTRTQFHAVAIDKFEWVRAQTRYLKRLAKQALPAKERFLVLQQDFLSPLPFKESSFDIVTAVSVLEHIGGEGDSRAMQKVYRLLKPGGRFLMSTPYNHTRPTEWYVKRSVYGQKPDAQGAFFQRHYSMATFQQRILDAAPFVVERMFYTGRYQRPRIASRLYGLPMPFKLIKVFYNWAAPFYAPHFLQLSAEPPSNPKPTMTTSDTVFVFLRKPD